MRSTGALLLPLAGLCLLALFVWSSSPEDTLSVHNRHRQLQAFSFSTRTTFPEQLDASDQWIHYGIYVGIIAAVFIIIGITISITLCIGFCCRRCCCNFASKGSKTCWVILFIVVYVAITVCCLCVIGFSVAMSSGIKEAQRSADTLVIQGVPGAFDSAQAHLEPLPDQIVGVVKGALDEIQATAFIPVDDLISFANGQVEGADTILISAARILNDTAEQFDLLRALFTRLAQYQDSGLVSGIPSNDTVPDVRSQTSSVLEDGRAAFADLRYQIGNLSQSVAEAKEQATYESSTVGDAMRSVNDTIGGIVTSIADVKQSFVNANISAKYVHAYDNYIDLQNKIRLPVLIVLAVLPIIMSGLWFLGACTSKRRCMLIGFWWGAGICWLLLILGAIHIILFVPIKDVCQERNELIVSAANQFVFKGTNYAASIGISSPAEAVSTINSAVAKFMNDPDLILDCKGDDTIITQLGIDLPGAFNVRETITNVTDQVRAEADKLNITGKIEEAQSTFSSMDERIQILAGNITSFNDTLANYTAEYAKARVLFVPSDYWNATTQAQAETSLEAVNNITNAPATIPRDFWTFDTIQDMDPNTYVATTTSQQRQTLAANKQIILNLMQLNHTVIIIEASFLEYEQITFRLDGLLVESSELISNTSRIVFESWSRINDSVSLPSQIVDTIVSLLDPIVDQLVDITNLRGLGQCSFLGDFVRSGVNNAICRDVGAAAGGVAISMILLAFIWLFSWPIILSSKTFFAASSALHNSVVDNDLWYEMDVAKQNKP